MQQPIPFDAMLPLDDGSLLELCAKGNEDAANVLVVRYLSLVHRKASVRRGRSLETDDLSQEGLIGLMDAIRTYRPDGGSSFATYASVCIDNRIRKAVARTNTAAQHTSDIALEDVLGSTALADEGENPESILIERERLQSLKRKMESLLSPFEREVLSCYVKGFSYEQMANMLHTTSKAVDNALQRVRRKLKIADR